MSKTTNAGADAKSRVRSAALRKPGLPGAQAEAPAAEAALVVAPPRLQRRPLVVLVSVALVILGALLSVWAYSSLGNAEQVVAVRVDVARGSVITAADLLVVRVGVDPVLHLVPASGIDALVGQRASVDLKAGQLLVPAAVTTDVGPHIGFSQVGLSLGNGQVPADTLTTGDKIRVVSTPGQQGEVVPADLKIFDGTVVSVSAADSAGKVSIVVEVPTAQAAELAARAATGKLAVILDARER